MAKQVKPLDPAEATLEIDPAITSFFKKGAGRARQVEKFDCHPGKQSRRVSFLLFLRRDGVPAFRKYPVALRLSSRDTRRLARMLAQAADIADGIE